ncbi:hypothetical protein EDD21DRAFT_343680 [Dissophora ornata]|nr:hypothetical protein EDD21DRAFT_343680 [Dissophora ornata]
MYRSMKCFFSFCYECDLLKRCLSLLSSLDTYSSVATAKGFVVPVGFWTFAFALFVLFSKFTEIRCQCLEIKTIPVVATQRHGNIQII